MGRRSGKRRKGRRVIGRADATLATLNCTEFLVSDCCFVQTAERSTHYSPLTADPPHRTLPFLLRSCQRKGGRPLNNAPGLKSASLSSSRHSKIKPRAPSSTISTGTGRKGGPSKCRQSRNSRAPMELKNEHLRSSGKLSKM